MENENIISARGFSRRAALKALAGGVGVAAVAGCAVSTTNGVTTITANVSEFTADTDTALNVAKTVLAFTGVPAAVVTAVDEGVALIETGLAAFKTYTGGSASITFNRTSVPAAVSSLIADIQTAASGISAVATSEASTLGASLTAKVSAVASDVASVASILSSAIASVSSVSLVAGSTPDKQAQQRAQQIDAIKRRHGLA